MTAEAHWCDHCQEAIVMDLSEWTDGKGRHWHGACHIALAKRKLERMLVHDGMSRREAMREVAKRFRSLAPKIERAPPPPKIERAPSPPPSPPQARKRSLWERFIDRMFK